MAQQSLYHLTQLESRVVVLPSQLVRNLKDNILENLRINVEKKVVESGIVMKVNHLISHNHGTIDREGFSGSTVYKVDYSCYICSPADGMEIVCVLTNMVDGFLICTNGPVIVMVSTGQLESDDVKVKNRNLVNKRGEILERGTHLKVRIVNYVMAKGQTTMNAVCNFVGLPSREEIESYERDQILVTGSTSNEAERFI